MNYWRLFNSLIYFTARLYYLDVHFSWVGHSLDANL
jgi:hypothetical protein